MIEAGGTKFVVGIGRDRDTLVATTRIPTTNPQETLAAVIAWFAEQAAAHGSITALGIGSFGPLSLDRAAADYGCITTTPKPGWAGTDFAGSLGAALACPVAISTDVNAAALAEWRWGAGIACQSVIYVTVGTGIGGGAIIDGRIHHGISHPEMGHFRPRRHPDDSYAGCCPRHGDCLEGLACGPAILERWGTSLSDLAPDHPAHGIIAYYIAELVVTLQAMFEPDRIVLGGGVMATPSLFGRIVKRATELGADYFVSRAEDILRQPALGDRAGLLGALALAESATA